MSSYAKWSTDMDKVIRRAGPDSVDAACARAADRIKTTARFLVPVGAPSIHIRNTIRVRKGRGPGIQYEVVAGSRKAFYTGFVEYGTAHSAAKPYMTPAAKYEWATGRLRRDIKDLFNG